MRRTHRKIDEEAVAIDALEYVLRTRCACTEVLVRREPVDPPDFTVTADGEPFPAEVTSIVSGQQIRKRYDNFANAISTHAAAGRGVFGVYALVVWRSPDIPKPTSKRGRPLLDAAVEYLYATRSQSAASAVTLVRNQSGQIAIEKVSDSGSAVGVLWTPPAMWASEIQNQLATLMQRAIDRKHGKLRDKGIDPRKALLLLYDAFGYASAEDAIAALERVNGYDRFHSIFWAASFSDRRNTTYPDEPGRNSLFLFSSDPHWNRRGTTQSETAS